MGRMALDAARRAGERRQGRAAPRALPRPCSTAIRCSSCRTGRTSTGSSATCCAAARRAARRLDRHLRRPLRADRARRARRPARRHRDAAVAAPRRASVAGRSLNGLAASARFARLRRRARRRRPRARGRAARARRRRRRARRSVRRRTAASSTGSASGTRARARARRRARRRRPRRLGRAAGVRLRLRGPDRRAVGAARGARGARRGDRLASVRAGPAGVRVARAHGATTSPRSRRGGSRSSRRATTRYAHAGARAPRARPLRRRRPPAPPPLEGAVRFLEGAGARGALELVGEEILELLRAGTRSGGDRSSSVPSLERLRAPLETAFGTLGIPFAVEGRVRLGQTAFGHALLVAAALRVARRRAARDLYGFLRSPYSGLAACARRLPRRAPARPRDPARSGSRRRR